MKMWFMAQSIVFKIASAVACVALVAGIGVGVSVAVNSHNATEQQDVPAIETVVDNTAVSVDNTPAIKEEVKPVEEVKEAPVEEAKAETEEVEIHEDETATTQGPVVEPEEPAKVKTGYKLENGNFAEGTFAFEIYAVNGEGFSYDTDKNGLSVNIGDTGSEDWHVQVKQNDIRLEQGRWYKLTLDAKSDISRSIGVNMMHNGMADNNWTAYANTKIFELGKNWKTYTILFCMNEATDNNSVFTISMGTVNGNHITKNHTVCVNNIKLEELPANFLDSFRTGTNLIANTEFAYDGLLWDTTIVNPGAANVSFANNKASFDISNSGSLDWHVQLKQSGIKLKKDTGYRLTFYVNSSVERWIRIGVMDTNYVNWYGGKEVYIAPGVNAVSVDIYNSIGDESNALLMISMGQLEGYVSTAGKLEISNVVFEENDFVSSYTIQFTNGGGGAAAAAPQGLGDDWEVFDFEGTHVSGSSKDENGAFVINVANTGSQGWHVQLQKKTLKLYKGKTYKISFSGKSTVNRDITWMVQMNGGSYTPYSTAETVSLTDEWQNFEQTFTMNADSDEASMYNFTLGYVNDTAAIGEHTVMLKDIVFEEVVTNYPEKTENGYIIKATHDKVTEYGDTFWKIALDPTEFGVTEDLQRKKVKISAKVQADGRFFGQLGVCTKSDWSGWVGNDRQEGHEGGVVLDWEIVAEDYQGSPQIQVKSMEGTYVEITDIAFEIVPVVPSEETTAIVIKKTDATVTEGDKEIWKVELDASKYGVSNPVGKNITVSVKVKSEAAFTGMMGSCRTSSWAWVDNGCKDYEAGEYTWTLDVNEYQGALQLQVHAMSGEQVEFSDIKVTERLVIPEGAIVINSTDEKVASGDNNIWKVELDPSNYGVSEPVGKDLSISLKVKSLGSFAGQIGACRTASYAWVDSGYKTYEAGEHEITLEVKEYQCAFQLQVFNMSADQVVFYDIKAEEKQAEDPKPEDPKPEDPKPEEPAVSGIVVKATDAKVEENGNSFWKVAIDPSQYGVSSPSGKNLVISVKLKSDSSFEGQMGACYDSDYKWASNGNKAYEAGEYTWNLEVTNYNTALQLQFFNIGENPVVITEITVTEKAAEPETPADPETPAEPAKWLIEVNSEGKGNQGLNPADYGIVNSEEKTVKVTAKVRCDSYFGGVLGGSTTESDWVCCEKQECGADTVYEWTYTFTHMKSAAIDIWWCGTTAVEIVEVKMEDVTSPEE